MVARALFVLTLAASASAQTANNDYSDPKTWLCRPGRQDACAVDLTTTIVAAHGSLKREEFKPNANPPITNGQVNASWGLHLIDVNLAMGNLVDVVGQQARAYLRANRRSQ
jgi:hypothetical protein